MHLLEVYRNDGWGYVTQSCVGKGVKGEDHSGEPERETGPKGHEMKRYALDDSPTFIKCWMKIHYSLFICLFAIKSGTRK